MLPQASQNGSPGIANVSPTSAFPRVFLEEKGPSSAHSAQCGASRSWPCLFPWTRPVSPQRDRLLGGASLLFCLELQQVRAGSPLPWADNGAEAL